MIWGIVPLPQNVTRGWFEVSSLGDSWSKSSFHTLVHGMAVSTVYSDLYLIANLKLTFISTTAGNWLGISVSVSIGCLCFLTRVRPPMIKEEKFLWWLRQVLFPSYLTLTSQRTS
jgi:hypothetical protein